MSVVIETTLGDITVDLFLHQRPVTCLNFLKLCKMKYYNFNLFHSIRSGFIAQTGDPTGEGTNGESVFGVLEGPEKRFFSGEKLPKIRHSNTGTLSMVCTGDLMVGSQFFFTLAPDLDSLDSIHCVIGEVTEGHDVLRKLNDVICDEKHRPYRDVRITHTVVLEDPFNDPAGLHAPSRSPSPNAERLKGGRIAPDEDIDEAQGKSAAEVQEMIEEKEAKARATILEIVGDLPDADIAPPENVLFVCKLNPVTSDEDLEIIFSRFGTIVSCEVIRDKKTGDSLQYAFVEFSDKKSCEDAYFKMDNVLIDDRRIHVDFSQSVSKMRYLGKGRGVQYLNDNKESALPAKSDKYSKHPDNDELRNGRTDKKHESRETDRSKDRHPRKDRHSSRDRSRKGSRSRHRHSPKRNRRSRSRSRRSRSHDRKHNRKDKGRDHDKSRDRKRRSPHSKSSKSHHDRSSDTRRNKSEAKDRKKSRDKSPSHSKKSSQYTDRKVKLQSSRHKNSRSHSKSPANHRRTQEISGNSKRTRKSRSRSPIEIINGPEQENSDMPSKKSKTESNIESGNEQCNSRKRDTEKTADLDQTNVIQSEEKVYRSESKSFSEKYEGADVELNKQNILHNWQEAAENAQLRTEIHQQTKKDPKFEQHNGEDDLQTQRLTSDTKEKNNSMSRSRSSSSVERENSKLGSKNKYENKQQPSNDLNEIIPVFSENSANISVSKQESNNHKKDHGYERPQGKKYTNSETEPSQHFSDKQDHNVSRRQSQSVERQRKDSQRIHEASQKQKDINKSKEERARKYSYEQHSGKEEEDLRQKPRGSNTDTHKENRSSSTSSDIADLKEKKQDKVKNQGLKEISSNEELKSHKEISKHHKDESKDQSKHVSKKSKDKKSKKVSTSKTKDLKKTDKRDKKVASKKKRKNSTSSSSSDSSDSSSSESSSSSEDERKKKRRKRKVSTSSSSSDSSSSSSSSSSSDSSSSSSESEPSRKKRKKVCHSKVSKKSRKSTKIK